MSANIIPTFKYHDAPHAIEWLCEAFGFSRHLVAPGEEGAIAHAQLTLGDAMIMLGSAGSGEFDQLQKPPSDVGGIETSSTMDGRDAKNR